MGTRVIFTQTDSTITGSGTSCPTSAGTLATATLYVCSPTLDSFLLSISPISCAATCTISTSNLGTVTVTPYTGIYVLPFDLSSTTGIGGAGTYLVTSGAVASYTMSTVGIACAGGYSCATNVDIGTTCTAGTYCPPGSGTKFLVFFHMCHFCEWRFLHGRY